MDDIAMSNSESKASNDELYESTDSPPYTADPASSSTLWEPFPAFECPSFSSLPFELREQIWLDTLTPRLIYLHPWQCLEKYSPDGIIESPANRLLVHFNHSTYNSLVTPAEVFASYAKAAAPRSQEQYRERSDHERSVVAKLSKYKSADPPVSLRTCRESRQVAIRKGYVLAFRDKKVDDEISHQAVRQCSERGIWVDFREDMIMLDATYRPDIHPQGVKFEPLGILMKYVPEDVTRIERLAIRGEVGPVVRCLMGEWQHVTQNFGWEREWQWTISYGWDNLMEIWIDDEFYAIGHDTGPGPIPLFRGKEEATVNLIVSHMRRGKAKIDRWTSELPSIKVVRGHAWKDHF